MTGPLGCGQHRAFLQERGGDGVLTELPWSSLSYGRQIDEISRASVSIPVAGITDEDCCWALDILQAWEHELAIFRDNEEVWVGPVGEPVYTQNAVTVPAQDLAAWFEVRILPFDRTYTATDLGTIFAQYVTDALSRDTSPGISVLASPVGVIGDRQVAAVQYRRAADELRELARTAIDWTMIGRTAHVGGEQVPGTTELIFVDGDLIDPTVTVRGLLAASEVIILGGAGHVAEVPVVGIAGGVDAIIGLVQHSRNENSILDTNSAEVAADADLALTNPPPAFLEGRLDPSAGVGFADLIPGAIADVRMQVGCKRVSGMYRLLTVDVQASASGVGEQEAVNVTLVPIGATVVGS